MGRQERWTTQEEDVANWSSVKAMTRSGEVEGLVPNPPRASRALPALQWSPGMDLIFG
jgi:hypothetical protein